MNTTRLPHKALLTMVFATVCLSTQAKAQNSGNGAEIRAMRNDVQQLTRSVDKLTQRIEQMSKQVERQSQDVEALRKLIEKQSRDLAIKGGKIQGN